MGRQEDTIVFEHDRDQVTVGDLRSWHYLKVTCSDCARTGQIYPSRLVRHGNGTRIVELVPGFKCMRCGSKGIQQWAVYKIAREV